MKITAVKVIVCSPGSNFVTLKIETDEGLIGYGDATLNGRELAVASYLTDHVVPCLIGRDAHQVEDIWQYLYKGAYWRRGPVTMSAIGAVDMALWDIKAKAANMPLYQLLGGRSRSRVLVYAHANGLDIAHTVEEVLRHREMGLRPSVRNRVYLVWRRCMGWPRANVFMTPPIARYRLSTIGAQRNTSATPPNYSRRSATPWGQTFTCCTTSITG